MSRDLGRDVPELEKLYVRKPWADFSHPSNRVAPDRTSYSTVISACDKSKQWELAAALLHEMRISACEVRRIPKNTRALSA